MLEAAGAPAAAIRAVRSPVGLIPSTRVPSSLAVSIMAEIAEAYLNHPCLPFASIAPLPHLHPPFFPTFYSFPFLPFFLLPSFHLFLSPFFFSYFTLFFFSSLFLFSSFFFFFFFFFY